MKQAFLYIWVNKILWCKNHFQKASLKMSRYPLTMFGIYFVLIIIAFVFLLSVTSGGNFYGQRNTFVTTNSIISLLLGKFSHDQFESSNRVLDPIFFFGFSVIMNWVMVNMFVSILNGVFVEVQDQELARGNDCEVVDCVLKSLKG